MQGVRSAWCVEALHRCVCTIKTCLCRTGHQITRGWRRHRERVSEDPAYGAALAGVVVAACELFTQDPRVVAVVAAVTTAYITISRAAHPDWKAGDDWL